MTTEKPHRQYSKKSYSKPFHLQPSQNEKLPYIKIAQMNETIIKTYLSLFVENQEQKLQFYG
jgi:hypothetical protein